NLRPFLRVTNFVTSSLLDFLVRLVLATLGAELLQFQPFRRGLLVLGAGIVPVLAFAALERDNFPHFRYPPYPIISVTAPLVRPPSPMANRRPLVLQNSGADDQD